MRLRPSVLLITVASLAMVPVNAQRSFRVLVLNGKNGKAVASRHVIMWTHDGKAFPGETPPGSKFNAGFGSNSSGLVQVDSAPDTTFAVSVDFFRRCISTWVYFNPDKIIREGIVDENTCKPALLRSKPEPGLLVIYVRPETFFEQMAH